MRPNTLFNVIRNAANPALLPEMIRKIRLRISESSSSAELVQWRKSLPLDATDAASWARGLNSQLWAESMEFAEGQSSRAATVLSSLPVSLGGAGFYALLFFLTRHLKPSVVVETGVAAGFSSRAFLSALSLNGDGHLYSSDFPYFRLKNPEKYIGVLVEESLRSKWTLDIRGDFVALPEFSKRIRSIDLFHYDSDKSAAGREFAMKALQAQVGENTVILFDDIQDNLHFKHLPEFPGGLRLIFEFGGKYIGLISRRDLR